MARGGFRLGIRDSLSAHYAGKPNTWPSRRLEPSLVHRDSSAATATGQGAASYGVHITPFPPTSRGRCAACGLPVPPQHTTLDATLACLHAFVERWATGEMETRGWRWRMSPWTVGILPSLGAAGESMTFLACIVGLPHLGTDHSLRTAARVRTWYPPRSVGRWRLRSHAIPSSSAMTQQANLVPAQ